MKKFRAVFISMTFGLGMSVAVACAQQSPVNLGSDSTFAVLGGTTVTVTGGGTNDQIRSYSRKYGVVH